ncbi:MAG: DUF6544 family protein [Paracoccaceae bacterium]
MQTAIAIVTLVLLALLLGHLTASRRFRTRILGLAARLNKAPRCQDVSAALPPLVAEYARRAGADPRRSLRVATFNQDSEIRLKRGGKFRPTVAWQAVSLGRVGFVWDARQDIGPFPYLRVVDAYTSLAGYLEARLFGSFPMARVSGPEISLGEAYRYLAELPWMPDAILGNPDLEWRVTARNIAEVRLTTPDGVARVSFRFDAGGDIVEMEAAARPVQDTKGGTTHLDWRGRFGEYKQIGPRRLPSYGEVGYVYPDGSYEAYFRGHIRDYQISG